MKLTACYHLRIRYERFETAIENTDPWCAHARPHAGAAVLATGSGPPLSAFALETVNATGARLPT